LEYLKGRALSEDLVVDGTIILEWILGKLGGKMWTGFIWFRIGNSGRLVNTIMNGFQKMGNFLTS
jgi:hypothetical protein